MTAGARAEIETAPKPAALTAIAWSKPMRNLIPTGIASIAGVPMSKTIKKNQSVKLDVVIRDISHCRKEEELT